MHGEMAFLAYASSMDTNPVSIDRSTDRSTCLCQQNRFLTGPFHSLGPHLTSCRFYLDAAYRGAVEAAWGGISEKQRTYLTGFLSRLGYHGACPPPCPPRPGGLIMCVWGDGIPGQRNATISNALHKMAMLRVAVTGSYLH